MFRRPSSTTTPPRRKWHPDDEETVLPGELGEPADVVERWPQAPVDAGLSNHSPAQATAPQATAPQATAPHITEALALDATPGVDPDAYGDRGTAHWDASEVMEGAQPQTSEPEPAKPAPASGQRRRWGWRMPQRGAPALGPRTQAESHDLAHSPEAFASAEVPDADFSSDLQSEGAPAPASIDVDDLSGPDLSPPFPQEHSASAAQPPARRRVHFSRRWAAVPLVLIAAAASWFALPIREVTVTGNQRLTEQQVMQAAGVKVGSGWLYYSAQQAAGLRSEPWVERAEIVRSFPGRIQIQITERTPYATLRESGRAPVAVASDGTELPGAPVANLPVISGWGPERTADALSALEALKPYHVQSVEYTPSGLTVASASSAAWSGDLESLLKYAGALADYPNKTIHIYPWGVSVQE